MTFQIEDGKGNGYKAEVNVDKQLVTFSISETEFEFISKEKGQAYSWASGTYDPAAGDTILLIKNTSSTKKLHIDLIILSTDTDTRVVIHAPTTEVTPTGTAITGTNLNLTSSNAADATAIRDETDNSQGNVIWSAEIFAASGPHEVDMAGALILGTNDSIGVDYVADVGACDVTIMGHFQ